MCGMQFKIDLWVGELGFKGVSWILPADGVEEEEGSSEMVVVKKKRKRKKRWGSGMLNLTVAEEDEQYEETQTINQSKPNKKTQHKNSMALHGMAWRLIAWHVMAWAWAWHDGRWVSEWVSEREFLCLCFHTRTHIWSVHLWLDSPQDPHLSPDSPSIGWRQLS